MYLVSVYFDDETNKRIQRYINAVAEGTGNTFMPDGKVPPHITVSAFEARDEKEVIHILEKKFAELKRGSITWCSVGTFLPYVIYIMPVLNKYLHGLSCEINGCLSAIEGTEVSKLYRPLHWVPHTTIGKTLSKQQMLAAFQILQESFAVFEGRTAYIGLAKPNPHRNLICVELQS